MENIEIVFEIIGVVNQVCFHNLLNDLLEVQIYIVKNVEDQQLQLIS